MPAIVSLNSNNLQAKNYEKETYWKNIQQSNGLTKPKGTLKNIQAVVNLMNTPLSLNRNKTTEGWEVNQKGVLEILWERRFMDQPSFDLKISQSTGRNMRKET